MKTILAVNILTLKITKIYLPTLNNRFAFQVSEYGKENIVFVFSQILRAKIDCFDDKSGLRDVI